MIDTATCFFDVFPVHPQPEPMESFTGYLTRLGEANRMPTIGELFITAFPNTSYQPPDATRVLNDYSTLAFGTLPQASMCSETALRATTLFHLGKKFGRLPFPQSGSTNAHECDVSRGCPQPKVSDPVPEPRRTVEPTTTLASPSVRSRDRPTVSG